MAIAVNDVVRAVYWQRLFGQRLYTVLHLRCVTAPPGTNEFIQCGNLALLLKNNAYPLVAAWRPLVGPSLLFDSVRVQKVWTTRGVYAEEAMGVTGTNANDASTANIAVSIEKRTLRPGRRGIGSVHVGGVPALKITGGEVDAAYLTSMQTCWENLLPLQTDVTGGVWSYCLFGGQTVSSTDDIMAVQAKTAARTMHRRTLRVGE